MAGDGRAAALLTLGALALRDRLASGALRATELAEACLAQVAAREAEIGAWAFIDPAQARAEAARLDALRGLGRPLGPLHGLPVGVKDIIDTAAMPTENGAAFDKDRRPTEDAWAVARLRAAGALILGKTTTTELAFLEPSKARNPVNPAHTPGGSSAGSAAAVAAGMAPLAVGTQTGGSVIRPAAYCGVVGFKPSFGAIGRSGVLTQSPTLDTVGVFAADLTGAALIADALFGHDPADPATAPSPPPRLLETALSAPPARPALAFVRPPEWSLADADTRDAFGELTALLGEACDAVDLPAPFAEAARLREIVNAAEMAKCYHRYATRGRETLSPILTAFLERGEAALAKDYLAALDWRAVLNAGLDAIWRRYDAILTPATPTPAPEGFASTGSAIFNGVWTFCGTPALTLPLLEAGNGMPIGVQLVGRRGDDARLMRTARWLTTRLAGADGEDRR